MANGVNSIDELAYVVAIAFDVGENSDLKISFQINMPTSAKEQSSGSESSESSSSVINTVECNSFDARSKSS